MRILIAEDDSILADGLIRSLRQSAYAVDHVKNGVEADTALSVQTFDLLILDLGLPRMSGLEVLRRLRARNSNLPVLILTAADSVDERVKGLDLGADDYMAKPFALNELEARVRARDPARRRRGPDGGAARLAVRSTRWGGSHISTTRSSNCRRANWACSKCCCNGSAGSCRRSNWSITCASGAKRSATTRSKSTCTGCARSSKGAACVFSPCAALGTAWRRPLRRGAGASAAPAGVASGAATDAASPAAAASPSNSSAASAAPATAAPSSPASAAMPASHHFK